MRKLINNKEKHVIEEMSSKELNNWIKTAESTNVGRFQYKAFRKNKWGIQHKAQKWGKNDLMFRM